MGVQYLPGFGTAYSRINRSYVNFSLSFILSLFYFLTIFFDLPFYLHLLQSLLTLWIGRIYYFVVLFIPPTAKQFQSYDNNKPQRF